MNFDQRTPAADSLEHWVKEFHAAGQEWVKAKLKADQLDEGCKNFLCALMTKIEEAASDEKISDTKLERLARSSTTFQDYVKGMCAARAEMLSKKVRFDALDRYYEAKRSGLSFEKEIIKKGIFQGS
jgi:hypothetical protein